jgi:hypothetical protein
LRRIVFFLLPSAGVLALFGACGSRTGLDALLTAEPDATPDVIVADVRHDRDAGFDAEAEAESEADAPIDVQFRDVPVLDICPDAGSTLIYVLTQNNDLYSFYPPTLGFTRIGTLACPVTGAATPFSMAVDRRGIAYSVFTDGTLFRVDTASAACQGTTYTPNNTFDTFGMGFVANSPIDAGAGADAGETLFIAQASFSAAGVKQPSRGLGSIDTKTYALTTVASFSPPILGPELTGTSEGRLFAFYTNSVGSGSHIVEVNKATGAILQDFPLKVGSPSSAYAFAFWGGYFWVFTDPVINSPTTVTRFSLTDLSEVNVTTMPEVIVGAGVSTCAPQ